MQLMRSPSSSRRSRRGTRAAAPSPPTAAGYQNLWLSSLGGCKGGQAGRRRGGVRRVGTGAQSRAGAVPGSNCSPHCGHRHRDMEFVGRRGGRVDSPGRRGLAQRPPLTHGKLHGGGAGVTILRLGVAGRVVACRLLLLILRAPPVTRRVCVASGGEERQSDEVSPAGRVFTRWRRPPARRVPSASRGRYAVVRGSRRPSHTASRAGCVLPLRWWSPARRALAGTRGSCPVAGRARRRSRAAPPDGPVVAWRLRRPA